MKLMIVSLRMGGSMKYTLHNADVALTAYDKLKAALAEYREFGNDRSTTIEINLDRGVVTFKLAEIAAVTMDTYYETDDPYFIARTNNDIARELDIVRRRRKAFEEAGIPLPEDKELRDGPA